MAPPCPSGVACARRFEEAASERDTGGVDNGDAVDVVFAVVGVVVEGVAAEADVSAVGDHR